MFFYSCCILEIEISMTFTIPYALRSQVTDHCLHFRARCWKIQLTAVKNVVFHLTDHTENLLLFDNKTYQAMASMDSSAQRREENLESSNQESRGIISSDEITFEMLQTGLFHNARVDEYIVDYRIPFIAAIDHITYFIRQVSFDGITWHAEIEGITALLKRSAGDVWGPMCRVPLFSRGNGKCNVSTALYEQSANITTIVDGNFRFKFTVTNTLWEENTFGNDGVVEFISTSSSLFGFTAVIKSYTYNAPDGDVILQTGTPFVMFVPEAVILFPGCDHIHDGHCTTRFDNLVNFQGEPFIPGGDRARRGISVR